jgi:hypothetical protein
MKRVPARMAYLASFFAARGLLFAAPLLLASSLAAADYAHLEASLATATLLMALLVCGTSGLVPIVTVGSASAGLTRRGIDLHHLLLAAVCWLLLPLGLWWPGLASVALLAGALAMTSLMSVEFKSLGRANRSLFLDALLLSSMAALAWLKSQWPALPGLWWAPAAILLWYTARLARAMPVQPLPKLAIEWRQALVAGFPLMLTTALATLVATSGRFGAGLLLAPDETAAYAVLSRGAALPIVAHQILTVAAFRRLYTVGASELQRLMLLIVGGVATSALVLWLIFPWLAWMLGPAFAAASQQHRWPLLLLLAQSTLWSGISLNDLLNVRHERSAQVLKRSLPAVLLLLPAAYGVFLLTDKSMAAFASVHALTMLGYFLAQTLAMRANGIGQPPLALAAISTFALLLGLYGLPGQAP